MKRKLIENYSLGDVLGEGSFGKVYKGTHTLTNQEFAVKVIPVQRFRENSRLEACSANQIKNLTRIEPSPFIVKFVEMLKTTNNFYFIYEYCNGMTLEAKLKQDNRLPQVEAMKIFGQLLEAFKILNKYNIMHRDLKPDNIFFHDGDVKLGDFGFCKTLMTQDDMTSTMLGSPIYMAPEVLRGEIYTAKADIWSLGVVLYEMLYGICPFESNSIAKLIAVLDNEELKFPATVEVSQNTKNLIRKLLIKDQFKRTNWFQLLTMQYPEENTCTFSITQSLSTKDSQRLNLQIKKYSSVKEGSLTSGCVSKITSQQSSKFFKSNQSASPQKALTFRKKGADQNSQNTIVKTPSLKVQEFTLNPESSRQYCEPLKKLQTNISLPALQRKLSSKSNKRRELLSSHNSCLKAIGTSLNLIKQGSNNCNIYSLIMLQRVEYVLQRISDSIGFSELELEDILLVCNEEIRQVSKQISLIQNTLRQSDIDPFDILTGKKGLKDYYDTQIDPNLWHQMTTFLNEQSIKQSSGDELSTLSLNSIAT